jgi:hypothetical protein
MADKKTQKKVGLIEQPRPVKTNASDDTQQREPDLLKLLESVFLAPTLSLVQIYLFHSNGSKKTIENCTLDFRGSHPGAWKVIFLLDFIFRLIYMLIVLLVVFRGLAIGDYIKSLLGIG